MGQGIDSIRARTLKIISMLKNITSNSFSPTLGFGDIKAEFT